MGNRGMVLADMLVACGIFVAAMSLATYAIHERLHLRHVAEAEVELELLQNLLAETRQGRHPALPPGWRIQEGPGNDGVCITTVTGPHVSASTILRQDAGR